LVISQFGKVLLLEKADSNLDVPRLTITVYAVYFGALMLGTFVFSRVRLSLPRPAEPNTSAQSRYLYVIALAGGLAGSLGVLAEGLAGGAAATSLTHGVARALAYMLPFSLVLAIDDRIRNTAGRHSLGWMALWPALGMMFLGFVTGGRTPVVEPVAIIFLTCFLRKFKFRRKHVLTAVGFAAIFFFFVSPYFLYVRAFRDRPTIGEQAAVMWRVLQTAPQQWETIKNVVGQDALASPGAANYFSTPGAVTLNRFALIGPDSTLINACATGFHYGFTSIKLDVLTDRNRPNIGSNGYLGHLDGQEGDVFETTNSTITAISDSFGAFSWAGVVVFPFLVWPAIFVIYESMFDMQRPWGTVATALFLFSLTEGSMGHSLTEVMVKEPAYILILSWGMTWIIKMIPVIGDRAVVTRIGDSRSISPRNQPSESAF
jgi:hypothetical protein